MHGEMKKAKRMQNLRSGFVRRISRVISYRGSSSKLDVNGNNSNGESKPTATH